jgi:hypothetical protein
VADLTTRVIAEEVITERERQDAKWGEQNHPNGTGPESMALARISAASHQFIDYMTNAELAASAKFATDTAAENGSTNFADILLEEVLEAFAEEDLDKLRVELVQVAAVAQQWIAKIDRQRMDELHAERADRRG